MRTNIDIDRELVEDAMRASGARTMREAVHIALRELVGRRDRKEILRLIGKLEWQGDIAQMRSNPALEEWARGETSGGSADQPVAT